MGNLKLTLLPVVFFLCTYSLLAQNILSGSITDESAEPIWGATVQVLSVDSIHVGGAITDEMGKFRIESLKTGDYVLAVSSVGFIKIFLRFEMPDKSYTLPTMALKADNIMLEGVTVTGSSFIQKKDHLLVLPNKTQVKHSFSGYDLLYNLMIPGLTVDRKNKTVSSMTGSATLYINGVEADAREVQNLQPKDIERVEYYVLLTNGKFAGDAASVNYITKTYSTGGYVTLDGSQNVGYLKGDYNLGAKLSCGNTNYAFWSGYTMSGYDGVTTEKREDLSFPDYVIGRQSEQSGTDYCNNQQYAQLKVSNDNKKRSLSASVSVVRDATPHDKQWGILDYEGYDIHHTESAGSKESESMRSSVNLNGIFYLNPAHQLKVRLNGGYTQNGYRRTYSEEGLQSLSDVDEDLYAFDAQVAHLFQPDAANSLYSRVTHFHNITSSLYGGDHASWQHLWKGETLFQFDYTHQFGKKWILMLSPGASCLTYKLHGQELSNTWNLRVNSWVRYVPDSKQWAGAGFSFGNNQPDISYLNTSSQTVDLYQIKRGNPYLDNTALYNWFAMYAGQLHTLLGLQCRAWYTMNRHSVSSAYFIEGDKLISSYVSDHSFNTANVELSVSSRISENLQTNVGVKYGYMYVPGKSGLSQDNLSASIDVNYFIRSFSVNLYARSAEKLLDEQTLVFRKMPVSYGLSVRYSGKNWMAEAGTENPFTKHVHYREYADYGVYRYNQVSTSRIYQQTAYVKLAYTFDFGKKTSRESNNIDRSINSAILKIE